MPRFETAWLKRAKYPYTSKSSAKVVRHAVAIDERRAKFRQNLISQKRDDGRAGGGGKVKDSMDLGVSNGDADGEKLRPPKRSDTLDMRFKPRRNALVPPLSTIASRQPSATSLNSTSAAIEPKWVTEEKEDDEETKQQDTQEIWFPGCHADIGGGWPQEPGMDAGLSHAPLLWMVREARKAGAPFDEDDLQKAGYIFDDDQPDNVDGANELAGDPQILVGGVQGGLTAVHERLHGASTRGVIHDSLKFGCGTPRAGVLAWHAMEYLPFRRME